MLLDWVLIYTVSPANTVGSVIYMKYGMVLNAPRDE